MASVFASSHLLTEAPRVAVRFEQDEGRTLREIRRQFGLFEAELRELNSPGRQANRTNPDYAVERGKEYELVAATKNRGWSKDTCRNASQLVMQAINIPSDCWQRPVEVVNNSVSVLMLLVFRLFRLVIASWMFTLGLASTGFTLPVQGLYHLFSMALRVLAPEYSADLPPLRHTPQFMFISFSCFLALIGSSFVFMMLLMSLVSQAFICVLELLVRSMASLTWVIAVCLGGSGFSARKRIDLLFFLVSLPWLNGVVFMSAEFMSRLTYLLATYFLMLSRHKLATLVSLRPAGSPAHRPALIQYVLVWAFPAVCLLVHHYHGRMSALYACWSLLGLSLLVPFLIDRESWNPLGS
ncbi:uncharacterized protein LOC135813776 [Sycon ciliatum]|uniref:uncharacterized protein LOC135813776 n=1 Tax=Sycon ciliatum TaxID=27933 RepID=UPI0020AAD109|eukprot:scpid85693/ scgid8364/ 